MTGPVRVLRVLTRLNVGGPARQAMLLQRYLGPEFDQIIAAGDVLPGEAELDHRGVDVARVSLERKIKPLIDVRACLQIRHLIESTDAAIVHTHMAKAGAAGRIAARSRRPSVRTVHTFHGHVFDGYFSSAVERVFVEAERRLARVTDVLVAVSPEIRDQLLALGIGTTSQYRIIPEGQDLEPYLSVSGPHGSLRRRIGVSADVPLVGVFGRLVPIKDHDTLLDAIDRLDGVHLAILGDGELRASLERRVAGEGLQSRVHFLGWVTDVAEALSDVDVVALTSRNEGTPVALIEALAAGRPAVATDVGGVRSVVADGSSGIVVPPGDAEAVAAGLKRLLEDPSLRRDMGAVGRAAMRDRYGPEKLVADTKSLYRELLER